MKNKGIPDGPFTIKEQLEQMEEQFKKQETKVFRQAKKEKHPIAFAIPLQSKTVSRDWAGVQANLSKTLSSILRNTDSNFRILVAGHEKPEIEELKHNRVKWFSVNFPPPVNSTGYGMDRTRKRRIIGAYLRKKGFSGYFVPLDADDWVHYRFVQYIQSLPSSNSLVLNRGLMVNTSLQEAWLYKERFYRACGSSAVYYFSNHELPMTSMKEDAQRTLFDLMDKSHWRVIKHLEEFNKDYLRIDIPLVTYVLGHGNNWSVKPGGKDNGISAKDYKAKGEKLRDWFYDYFKVNKP